MDEAELADQISQLELRIDQLAESLARCRKMSMLSRFAIAAGGMLIAALILGAIDFDPMLMVGAIAAVLGGIVLYGSNSRTAADFAAEIEAAERRRSELIGRIDLRLVEGNLGTDGPH